MTQQDRFRLGPFTVPVEVLSQRSAIHLFMTYLDQRSTKDILCVAAGPDGHRSAMRHINSLLQGYCKTARNEEELCYLIPHAIALKELVDLARQIGEKNFIPAQAIPSESCLNAMVDAYHGWVEQLARLD